MIPLIITIVIVIVIIYLSFLASRFMAVGTEKMNRAKHIKIIDRLVVGQEKMLAIVQIADRYFFVGITGESIQMLAELQKEDMTELLPDLSEKDFTKNFKDLLSKSLLRGGKK